MQELNQIDFTSEPEVKEIFNDGNVVWTIELKKSGEVFIHLDPLKIWDLDVREKIYVMFEEIKETFKEKKFIYCTIDAHDPKILKFTTKYFNWKIGGLLTDKYNKEWYIMYQEIK